MYNNLQKRAKKGQHRHKRLMTAQRIEDDNADEISLQTFLWS